MPPASESHRERPRTKLLREKLKVKTGCITCRIRKVKCGEERPSCTRCKSTGRTCDGYAAITPPAKKGLQKVSIAVHRSRQIQRQPSLSVDAALLSSLGTGEERRFLDFFHRHTGRALSGVFATSFWTHLLPQLSQSEPALRHALLAVGSLHAHYESSENSMKQVGVFTLQQYNKAIFFLKNRLSEDSVNLTLICCVLFISLECLRSNRELALSHLKNGLNILKSNRTKKRELSSKEVSPLGADFIDKTLFQIFSRLDAQMTLFGLEPSDGNRMPTVPMNFANFFEAKASMDALMAASLRFVKCTSNNKYVSTLGISERTRQLDLQYRLQQWSSAVDALRESPGEGNGINHKREEILLRLQHMATYIWLSTCLVSYETIFDAHTRDFEAIVTWVKELGKLSDTTSVFTLDMAVIPPLFLTAIKCRQPWIRRKALQQLYATPRREGLWNAILHARVAERVIEIEESSLTKFENTPSEVCRIHNAQIVSSADSYPARICVTFYTKPNGLDHDFFIWEENFGGS